LISGKWAFRWDAYFNLLLQTARRAVSQVRRNYTQVPNYPGDCLWWGSLKRGTFFDPDRIAESYWELYTSRNKKEILYKEEA
jgi:hypothetical protein